MAWDAINSPNLVDLRVGSTDNVIIYDQAVTEVVTDNSGNTTNLVKLGWV